jgi:hypothetical protein
MSSDGWSRRRTKKGGDEGEGASKVNQTSSLEGTVNEMRDRADARSYRRAGTGNGKFRDLTRAEPPRPNEIETKEIGKRAGTREADARPMQGVAKPRGPKSVKMFRRNEVRKGVGSVE